MRFERRRRKIELDLAKMKGRVGNDLAVKSSIVAVERGEGIGGELELN